VDGWANALKPAWEPIVLADEALDGTLAHNAEKWGVAGMNIDAARIGENPDTATTPTGTALSSTASRGERIKRSAGEKGSQYIESAKGRWPANVLLDKDAAAHLANRAARSPAAATTSARSRRRLSRRHGKAGDAQVAYGDFGVPPVFLLRQGDQEGTWAGNDHLRSSP